MASKPRNKASMDAEAVARMMAAQEQEEPASDASAQAPPAPAPVEQPAPPAAATPTAQHASTPLPPFDPGKMDGRTLRRTGREPFATRIKPEAHEALRRIAYHRRITIAEALEMAVAAFDKG